MKLKFSSHNSLGLRGPLERLGKVVVIEDVQRLERIAPEPPAAEG